MKLLTGLVLLLVSCGSCLADVSFGDKITNVLSGDSSTFRRASKGDRFLIEREEGQDVVDVTRKTITVFDKNEKVYRTTPINAPRPAKEEAILKVMSGAKIALRDAGVSSQIGGLRCKKFILSGTTPWPVGGLDSITQAKVSGEVWASNEVKGKDDLLRLEQTMQSVSVRETIGALAAKGLPAGHVYVSKTILIELGSDAASELARANQRKQLQQAEGMRPQLEEAAARGSEQAKQMLKSLEKSKTGAVNEVLLNLRFERVEVSTAPLSEMLFAVPPGYRKLK